MASRSCSTSWPTSLEGARGGRVTFSIGEATDLTVIEAGWLVDIDEVAHEATLWIPYDAGERQQLTLRYDCAGEWATHTLVLEARRLRWSAAASWQGGVDGPAAREHAPLWLARGDENTLMMYGGFVFAPQPYTVDDTLWALDLQSGSWREILAPGRPSAAGLRVAPNDGSQSPYFFGGHDTVAVLQRYLGETEGFEPLQTAAPLAGAVQLGGLVYDVTNKRLVSFCGLTGGQAHCDVLVLGTESAAPRWEALKVEAPDGRPEGRYGMHYAYVPSQGRVVLFSGARMPTATDPVNAAQDSWALDLDGKPTWRRLAPTGEVPSGRRNGCFAFDRNGLRLLVWGGTADASTAAPGLFALRLRRDQERWDRVEISGAPPARASCSGIYDHPRRRALFGFGNTISNRFADLHALEL